MDKHILIDRLAKMTATLSPSDQRNAYLLKRLRSELAAWLIQNPDHVSIETVGMGSIDEPSLPDDLRNELFAIAEESLSASPGSSQDLRIVKRDVFSEVGLGELTTSTWSQGQQAAYSLGPFLDEYGKLSWFDFYQPTQLRFAIFKGESIPFLKFSWTNYIATGTLPEINLGAGSVWIRSNYLDPMAPANSFVGLKIESGQIRFNEQFSFFGGNVLINSTDTCHVSLTLAAPQITASNNFSAGRDALESSANLPKEVSITFTFQNGKFEQVGDGNFRLYDNEYNGSYNNAPAVYEEKLQRIAIPLNTSSNELNIHQVRSTLFQPSERAKVQGIFWALPITIDDHNKLGEASGNGGFLLKTDVGVKAGWMNLQKGPVALGETNWIVEPGKIELHAFKAKTATNHKFYLWWEDRVEKRSSVAIDFLKESYIKYYSIAADEIELITADVNLKGHFDKPLMTDGKRIKANYTNVQYSLGQYKQDTFIQCISRQHLQKLIALKQFDELKPISIALSNAFTKISPCDEFILTGRVVDNDSVEKGNCSFLFGLYSLIPIFADPYVSNIELNIDRERERFLNREPFRGYLQVRVNWIDIADPKLIFSLRHSSGSWFSQIQPNHTGIYTKLKNRNSDKRVSHVIKTTDENGAVREIEVKALDILKEDEDNDKALKDHYEDFAGGSTYPNLFVLDVSSNAYQFGIGLSTRAMEPGLLDQTFKIEGIDLVSQARNLHVVTLPPVQWEAIKTIQNPDVQPYPFPSPAHSLDTGEPVSLSQVPSYHLLPITPQATIDHLVTSFRNLSYEPGHRSSAIINLPFGMKALLRLEQYDFMGAWVKNVNIEYNQPHFENVQLAGGTQLNLTAIAVDKSLNETPGFAGATIQTRNLVDKNNDVLGISVLGFAVDTIFNTEFKIGGDDPRVPLKRIDISGYGASTFSDWRNPDAQIATTSQARFDVIVGRTSHEVVQVRSILYCCGASVVRTITIQRTAGGGVTRHDSGWVAEGPGLYDFSYRLKGNPTKEPNPYTFHLGSVKAYYNITNIKDTLRIVEIPPLEAGDKTARLQEVIFDANILIEDVTRGQSNNLVPSKGQKGFVQLSPSGRPISASQLTYLLKQEGPVGGPVDCMINVALSGQEMRGVRVDTNRRFGSTVFVNAVRGSLVLPNEGAWGIVLGKNNNIEPIQNNSGLALVRYNASPSKYEFSEPADDPVNKFGLVHSSSSHRTLFLQPHILKNDPVILSDQPYFADLYALKNSLSYFPPLNDCFSIGAGGGKLKVHGSGLLEMVSSGTINIAGKTRVLSHSSNFKSYIEYADANGNSSTGGITINSQQPDSWAVDINDHKLVYDVESFSKLFIFNFNFKSSHLKKAELSKPKVEYGSFLKTLTDILRFLEDFDPAEPFELDLTNNSSHKNLGFKIKSAFKIKIEFSIFPVHFKIKYPEKGSMQVIGPEPPKPPEFYVNGTLYIGAYSLQKPDGKVSDGLHSDKSRSRLKNPFYYFIGCSVCNWIG